MDSEQRQHLQELRGIYIKRLRVLERQAANKGQDTPPHIQLEIEELKPKVTDIDDILAGKKSLADRQRSRFARRSLIAVSFVIVIGLAIVAAWLTYNLGNNTGRQITLTQMQPTIYALQTSAADERQLLQRLEFKYKDSPVQHGWRLVNSTPITFTSVLENFQGIQITTNGYNGIETNVSSEAEEGALLEIVVKPTEDSPVYASVNVRSKDDPSVSKSVWLKFYTGVGENERALDNEYKMFVQPEQLLNGWMRFQVNLTNAINESFGKEGWEYERLKRVRIRGNISLAYLAIYNK